MEILVTIGYIALCILFFSLAIAIHEFGHFIVALKLGLRVERFSIGFGPAIWKKTWHGVEYRISWIPLGGYVSIPDVDPEGTKAIEGEKTPSLPKERIPAWKEIAVAFAGPAMNIVLAVVLAVLLACVPSARFGEDDAVLDDLVPTGPVARAGLKAGDRIVSVDGQPVKTWFQFLTEVQLSDGRPQKYVVRRDGETFEAEVTPVKDGPVWRVGAAPAMLPEVGAVDPEGTAAAAGIRVGDRIISFAGRPVATWSAYLSALDECGTATNTLVVKRGDEEISVSLAATGRFVYQFVAPFERPPVLGTIEPDTVAGKAGLEPGDRVVAIGGTAVATWSELQDAVQATKGAETEFRVLRGTEEKTFALTPVAGEDGRYYIQAVFSDGSAPELGEIAFGSAADKAGFRTGDRIVSVAGVSVSNWRRLDAEVHRKGVLGEETEVVVRRGETDVTLTFKPTPKKLLSVFEHGIGSSTCAAWMNCRSPLGQLESDASGIFRILKALVTPKQAKATGKALGGPVMIARGIYASVRSDFWSGLGFLRYLNINLAILNLLPIPVLDGGLIFFALIALVFRRRVPDKVVGALSMAFMFLLLAGMATLIWRDSVRWVDSSSRDAETIDYHVTDHALEN